LFTELVAGKSDDRKTLVGIVVMKRTQTCVLISEASERSDINYEHHLALVVTQTHGIPRDGVHFEIVETRHLFSLFVCMPA